MIGVTFTGWRAKMDERAKLCSNCPKRQGVQCSVCGCPALFRRINGQSCPLGKW